MNIKKSVEHIVFKLGKGTPADKTAINSIMDFVEAKHKKQYQDHHLFAKLYIMVYAQFLERYKATVFEDIPKKELSKFLDQPLTHIIQRFTDRLNESELYSLFDELNVNREHPILQTPETKVKELNTLKTALNDSDNKDRFEGNVWDYETVKDHLELQINEVVDLLG